jgi:hypothetical protein
VKAGTVVVGYLDPGQWSACFGLSYRDLCLFDLGTSQRIMRAGGKDLRGVVGTMGVAEGRNKIARDFMDATDAEWLFMIDTDMGFARDTVDRLVASADKYHRPVMGGLCFAIKRQRQGDLYAEKFRIAPTVYDMVQTPDGELGFRPIVDYPRDQVVKVAGTGCACLLINRRALHKVREKFGDAWFEPMVHPTAGGNGQRRGFSEDLSFCMRLYAVDVPVHVDTKVKTCHEKGGIFLDEDAFDKQQALAAMERAGVISEAS